MKTVVLVVLLLMASILSLSACAPHEIYHHMAMRKMEKDPAYEDCMSCHKDASCKDCHVMTF
jgi:hypothetical protein